MADRQIEKAYIRVKDGLPTYEASLTVWHGLLQRGIEVEGFTNVEDILPKLTPETLVHGGVGDARKAVTHLGKPAPDLPTLPPALQPLLGRTVATMTLEEARRLPWPFFMKPVEHKLFTGHVVGAFKDHFRTSSLPENALVHVQGVVNFVSEYRAFIHKDEVIGMKHYAGDFRIPPDVGVADQAIEALMKRELLPVAFSVDLGVLDTGQTVVVEVNDAFALGNYGLNWPRYLPMVMDRWLEMTGDPVVQMLDQIRRFAQGETSYRQFANRFIFRCVGDAFEDPCIGQAYLRWCEYTSLRDKVQQEALRRDIRTVWATFGNRG